MNLRTIVLVFAFSALVYQASEAQSIQVLAQTGDAVPDDDGVFDNLSAPLLGDSGRASFFSFVSGDSKYDGLFVVDGDTIRTVARQGAIAPDTTGSFSTFPFSARGVNDSGNLVFRSDLINGDSDQGVFVGNGLGTIAVAVEGSGLPNGGGTFLDFGTPSINQKNQVAFEGCLTLGMYFFDPAEGLIEITRAGDPTPVGGQFSSFRRPLLNEQQQQVFYAAATIPTATGVYLATSDSIIAIATQMDPVPNGDGEFDSLSQTPSLNDEGDVVFHAALSNPSTGGEIDGLYLHEDNQLIEVVRTGQAVPGGDGVFGSFGAANLPVMNDSGRVVFRSELSDTKGDGDSGIYMFENGLLVELFREGVAVDAGTIAEFDDIALNDNGQIAFSANVDTGTAIVEAIFFFCPNLGLLEAIRESDSLLGAEITSLSFPTGMQHNGDEKSGFNNSGQIAFNLRLEDDREAIAIWSPPVLLGDINSDCQISLLDVAPFVELIQSGEFRPEGDFNGDGVVGLLDIGPFVELLTSQ